MQKSNWPLNAGHRLCVDQLHPRRGESGELRSDVGNF